MSTPATTLVISLAIAPGTSGLKMHNAGYKALGLNYSYSPRKYDGDIKVALDDARAQGIRGISLTMPYKISCLPFLDELSPTAKEIGAVNTVVNQNGKLMGHNTDAPAAEKLIREYLPWQSKPLVILGGGGMAHAFAYVAKKLKAKAYISARDEKKAEQLAQKFQLQTLPWGSDKVAGTIICNATPIGMNGQDGAFPFTVDNLAGVFDAVANPADTALVRAAKAQALPVVSGDRLALEQACLQFTLYTGHEAPREAMREALYA